MRLYISDVEWWVSIRISPIMPLKWNQKDVVTEGQQSLEEFTIPKYIILLFYFILKYKKSFKQYKSKSIS